MLSFITPKHYSQDVLSLPIKVLHGISQEFTQEDWQVTANYKSSQKYVYIRNYMYNFVMLLPDCSKYYNTQCHALSQLSVGLWYICM